MSPASRLWAAGPKTLVPGKMSMVRPVALFIVRVNVVVRERDPATPVTVIVDVPAPADAETVRVSVDEHAGLHDAGEKEVVTPMGSPAAENDTDCGVPETSVAVMVLDTDWP